MFRKDGNFFSYACICVVACWEICIVLVANVMYIKFPTMKSVVFVFNLFIWCKCLYLPLFSVEGSVLSLLIQWHSVPMVFGGKAFMTGQALCFFIDDEVKLRIKGTLNTWAL